MFSNVEIDWYYYEQEMEKTLYFQTIKCCVVKVDNHVLINFID